MDLDAAFAAMRESYEGWLAEHGATPPLGTYVGYELVPAMVEAACELHADPRARFEVGTEVREEADYARATPRRGRAGARACCRGRWSRCATARRCSTSLCSCAAAGSVPGVRGFAASFYDVVLWVHITAVVIAFGALFAYPVFLAVVAKRKFSLI